jgi:hypothetical protein
MRTTEVRIEKIEFDEKAKEFISELAEGEIRIVTNRREVGDVEEYRLRNMKSGLTITFRQAIRFFFTK